MQMEPLDIERLRDLRTTLIDRQTRASPTAVDILQECINHLEKIETFSPAGSEGDDNPGTCEENKHYISAVLSMSHQLAECDEKDIDEESWGSSVPDAFLLKDMIGEFPISQDINNLHFSVRGENYLKKSVKVPSSPPLFRLRGMQFVEHSSFIYHVAQQDWCPVPHDDPFNEWFVLNYMVPGRTCVHVICIFSATKPVREVIRSMNAPNADAIAAEDTRGWARCVRRFWKADREYCDEHFKLFPRCQEASWAIQLAVGKKPALVGNKRLVLQYHRGKGYFEVDLDMSSSTIATNIIGMVRGVSRSMVMDMGVAIEAAEADELPEVILCQVRMSHMDLDHAVALPSLPLSPSVSKAPTPISTPAVSQHHGSGGPSSPSPSLSPSSSPIPSPAGGATKKSSK